MDIERTEIDGVSVAAPVGRVDSNTARELEAVLVPLFDEARAITVDFERLTYISSAGLRVVLIAAKLSKAKNVPLALAGLSQPVREVFQISGFAKLFAIHDNRALAIASLADQA